MSDASLKEQFTEVLAGLGGKAGNGRLREALGWDDDIYEAVKQALIDDRAIVPGRGRRER
jgi:type I restriction enzyme M protein